MPGHIILDFPGGARAVLDGNRHLDHATDDPHRTFGEALVEGTGRTLTLDGAGRVTLRAFGRRETTEILAPRDWPGFAGDCVHALQSHVLDALAGTGALEISARDYLTIRKIEDAAYRSALSGCKINL
jgi:hypothetical protein